MIGPIVVAIETDADGYDIEICNHFWYPKEMDHKTKMAKLQHKVDQGIFAFKWKGANKRKFVAQALQRGHGIRFTTFDVAQPRKKETA